MGGFPGRAQRELIRRSRPMWTALADRVRQWANKDFLGVDRVGGADSAAAEVHGPRDPQSARAPWAPGRRSPIACRALQADEAATAGEPFDIRSGIRGGCLERAVCTEAAIRRRLRDCQPR
jgi:hypothetical protein